MAHRINDIAISDMLIVCPFRFETNYSCPIIDMQNTRAIFRAVTTKIPDGEKRPLNSDSLTEQSDFKIRSKNNTVLEFTDFALQSTATMASLDMVEAIWLLRGRATQDAKVTFSPVHVPYNRFNKTEGNAAYWGAVIKHYNDTFLRLSLSAPVYHVQGHYVVSCFAMGPAHGHLEQSSNPSLFQWVVSQAGEQNATEDGDAESSDRPFGELELEDLRTRSEDKIHRFFGDDGPGKAQVASAGTGGAVFVASGAIIEDMNWRSLSNLVRIIAQSPAGEAEDQKLLRSIPPSRFEQTVHETNTPELRNTSHFRSDGQVFEGIMLWNLQHREGDDQVKSIHR